MMHDKAKDLWRTLGDMLGNAAMSQAKRCIADVDNGKGDTTAQFSGQSAIAVAKMAEFCWFQSTENATPIVEWPMPNGAWSRKMVEAMKIMYDREKQV